jgi:hypothetical protein
MRQRGSLTSFADHLRTAAATVRAGVVVALLGLGVGAVGGCSSGQIRGISPTLEQTSIISDERAQADLVAALIRKAYLRPEDMTASDARWAIVAEAGLYEIDRQCDQYLAALFTFNRDQRAARQGLTAVGATTAAILGISGAAGPAIALTAASFGLAASLFDAGVNSVLFTIEPSALRAVMLRGRQAYLATINWKDVTTRPRMMIVLQGYLAQCTPAAIEANINNAATGAPSVASTNTDIALKAAAMAAPSATIVQNPEVWIARPTTRGGSQNPPPVPTPDVAPNLQPEERATITTKEQVRQLQRALGVTADGDLGPYDPAKLSETRAAIEQFQAGVNRQPGDKVAQNGLVDGATYSRLRAASAAALPLKSGFERGLLTNRTDQFRTINADEIERVISLLTSQPLQPAATTPDALAKRIQFMREAILAYRQKPGMPVPLSKASDALDSALYEQLEKSRPNIPQPGR